MIQFLVGALAVVGLSELAKSKKMPKMANGGKIDMESVEEEIRSLKSRIKSLEEINTKEAYEQSNKLRKQLSYLQAKYSIYANGGSMSDDDYLIDDDEMSDSEKSNVEKFFSLLFESRDVAHKEHLKTKNYATHIALNEYYEGVLPLIDGLVESYQGIYGIVEIPEWKPKYENPIIYLKDLLNTIDAQKEELFTDSSLLNQVDEIKALVQSTLYKLENLS